ncbi:C-C chemokine receptor type 7 [Dissostichus eleginoides]|uniref:C-C chemokine receptor type 7 n=1 Tax=Dissostichus eleginoides TaxID=100907 RepID=A0AAD9BQ06_DISEL|nr:C-C chemokine receptor type 7 [Dissostichus eleginoides]
MILRRKKTSVRKFCLSFQQRETTIKKRDIQSVFSGSTSSAQLSVNMRYLPNLLPAVLIWLMQFKYCLFQHEENTTSYPEKISSLSLQEHKNVKKSWDNSFTMDYDNFTMDFENFSMDYSEYTNFCVKESNHQFRRWFMSTFYSIIFFLGLTGNLLVILTFFYFKRLKTMTDVFLLNLSFADLLFALSLPFWAANSMAEWVLGLLVCKAMHTVYKVSFYSSMFILSFISVERYFVIAKAVSAYRYRSKAVFLSKVSSAAIWVMALIFSIPEMRYTTVNNKTCTPYSSNSDKLRVSIQSTQIVLAFALPLLIMSICYSSIIQTLSKARSFERNRAIKVILAVVAVFLVSQVPYNLVLFLNTVVTAQGGTVDCDFENNLLYATDVTQCVAFLRCCLNPFVYAFIGVKFRHDLLKLMKELGCMSQSRFVRYKYGRRRSSGATETETTTTFSP